MSEADGTREQILRAAVGLLRHHGPAKTTVVDIARACGMSHANVYRYFDDKTALLTAVTDAWLGEQEAGLRAAAGCRGSAAKRLEEFLLAYHRVKVEKLRDDPNLAETQQMLLRECPAAVYRHVGVVKELAVGILQAGVAAGEFAIKDVERAFGVLRDATARFYHPVLLAEGPPGLAEADCRAVVRALAAAFAAGAV